MTNINKRTASLKKAMDTLNAYRELPQIYTEETLGEIREFICEMYDVEIYQNENDEFVAEDRDEYYGRVEQEEMDHEYACYLRSMGYADYDDPKDEPFWRR